MELIFSEKNGGKTEVYTVRREPIHMRFVGKEKKEKRETGKVTLTFQDNTQYAQKDANQKIEEIVGLTKNQFMQVAMIAQGEFR